MEFPNLENLITVRPPRKIKEAILVAHHCVYLEELEGGNCSTRASNSMLSFIAYWQVWQVPYRAMTHEY